LICRQPPASVASFVAHHTPIPDLWCHVLPGALIQIQEAQASINYNMPGQS